MSSKRTQAHDTNSLVGSACTNRQINGHGEISPTQSGTSSAISPSLSLLQKNVHSRDQNTSLRCRSTLLFDTNVDASGRGESADVLFDKIDYVHVKRAH